MFYATYISRAVAVFSNRELKRLLLQSRMRNNAVGITGTLLFHEGTFLQALEGEEEVVKATLARIGKDPRHDDIRVLASASHKQNERTFGEWAMGFLDPGDTAKLLTGFVALDNLEDFSHMNAQSAMNLLRVKTRVSAPSKEPSSRPRRFGDRPVRTL